MVLFYKVRLQQTLKPSLADFCSTVSHISEHTVKLVIIKHFSASINLHFRAVCHHIEAKIVEVAQKSFVLIATRNRFALKGLANGHFSVGRSIGAVYFIPFRAHEGRLAVYLVSNLGIELRSLRQKANIAHFGPGFVAIIARQVSMIMQCAKKRPIVAFFDL